MIGVGLIEKFWPYTPRMSRYRVVLRHLMQINFNFTSIYLSQAQEQRSPALCRWQSMRNLRSLI
jgi:hypothetical protein